MTNIQQSKWLLNKVRRRSRQLICRKFFKETELGLENAIIISGTARCGSTWIAEVLAAQLHSRIVFEPFDNRQLQEISHYPYLPYLRPESNHPDFYTYCQKAFSGRMRHPWLDREVNNLRPSGRVIKAVRANLIQAWLENHFPSIPRVLIVRHPCAVVHSRMRAGWNAADDLKALLAQPLLREDFLEKHLNFIQEQSSPEARHALIWCIQYYIPFRQLSPVKLNLFFYEHLLENPNEGFPRLMKSLKRQVPKNLDYNFKRPSTTTAAGSALFQTGNMLTYWQSALTSAQIKNILNVVAYFGLDGLYDTAGLPNKRVRENIVSSPPTG